MDFSIIKQRSGKPYAIVLGKENNQIVASCSVFKSATGYYCSDLETQTREHRKLMYDYIARKLGGELRSKDKISDKESRLPTRGPNDLLYIEAFVRELLESTINMKYVEEFVQDTLDNDENTFSFDDADELAIKTKCNTAHIIKTLKDHGLVYTGRAVPKRIRGFNANSHDRWSGPGSSPTHGGASTDAISGFAGSPADRRR